MVRLGRLAAFLIAAVGIASLPRPAAAQRPSERWARPGPIVSVPITPQLVQTAPRQDAPIGRMVVMGTLGGFVGFIGGGYLGYQLERSRFPCYCEDPGLVGLVVGSALGSALLVPALVHVANEGRGSLLQDMGVSLLIGGLGLAGVFATATSDAGLIFVFAPPVAEIIATTLMEASATREGS